MAIGFSHSSPATGAEALFALKALLKLQGWTVLSSSDGTTYNPAGDQITVPSAGPGGMANARAWFRLLAPVGTAQMIFQRSAALNTQWRNKFSPDAGCIGGAPAATVTPSATDEILPLGGGTDAAPTFSTWLPADGSYRWNCAADNAAPIRWYSVSFPNGGGLPTTSFLYESLVGTAPGDGSVLAIQVGQPTALNVFGAGQLSITNTPTNVATYAYLPALVPLTWQFWPCILGYGEPTSQLYPSFMATNPLTVKDEIMPIMLARRSAQATPGYKGIFGWLRWCGTTRATGDTLTVTTPRDRIVFGDCSLPWDGTVPVV